jgi:threonine/homoserine/homoserine lactone efflux protein
VAANLTALTIATLILVILPGPNVALIAANSVRYGFRAGAITVFGTTLGVAIQLAVVLLGLAAIIEVVANALTWIRWAGVAYLVWLGIRTWLGPAADLGKIVAAPAVFWKAVAVAAMNPKTLLFNAAFLPQFIAVSGDALSQMAIVAAVFLTVLMLGDLLWVALAGSSRTLLLKSAKARNRITGGLLVVAGIGLALSRQP